MTTRRVKRGRAMPDHMHTAEHTVQAHADYVLLALVIGLSLFGLLMVYDASVVVAAAQFGSKFFFVQQQAISLVIGIVGLLVASKVDYHWWKKLALPMLIVGSVMLLAVFVPGLGRSVNGARRWLDIGPIGLQPAYLLCFALIAYFSSWLSQDDEDRLTLKKGLLPFMVVLGSILGVVVVLQRDLGTALILAGASLSVYFLAGLPMRHLATLIPIGALGAGLVILMEPYRLKRILSFSDSSHDVLGASYHINQVLIALGSGGWLGVGLGQSRQKYQYIPEVYTDSIFAILAEELGLFGTTILIGLFLYLLWRGLKIAMKAPDMFGRLLAGGIIALVGIQVFINLFAMTAVIPLTGVPLPFISYGGTSLIVLLSAMGVVLNISRQVE